MSRKRGKKSKAAVEAVPDDILAEGSGPIGRSSAAGAAAVATVEDVVTTGGSTRETMDVARAAGAIVVGACAIVDRSGGKQGLDVPFHALLPMDVQTYQPDACPLCQQGIAVVKPGSRTPK